MSQVRLAIPGQVVSAYERDGTAMAEVDLRGVRKQVCLQYLPGAGPGDYVIVHVGFAMRSIREWSWR